MESYVPLVKAIIISTMFSWGTSSVTISDQYIVNESNVSDPFTEREYKETRIYDLKSNVIHIVQGEGESRISFGVDSLDKYDIKVRGSRKTTGPKIVNTDLMKEDLGEYKCKREIKHMQQASGNADEPGIKNYTDNSYFAKISWLDKYLNTKVKREFAGFNRQEYSPYHYLVYEVYEYSHHTSKDQIMRIIEKSEVDTTFIHTLLTLPLKSGK